MHKLVIKSRFRFFFDSGKKSRFSISNTGIVHHWLVAIVITPLTPVSELTLSHRWLLAVAFLSFPTYYSLPTMRDCSHAGRWLRYSFGQSSSKHFHSIRVAN